MINPHKEEEVGQEEADGELQVESRAGVLDGSTQEEGEGCQDPLGFISLIYKTRL